MDETIRIQRATVEEHIRHENAKNWEGVYDTFVRDTGAFYDVVPLNARFPGFSGVKGFYEAANAAFPDFKIDVWGEYDAPGCSVREVTISGTHTGDWCGVPGPADTSGSSWRASFYLVPESRPGSYWRNGFTLTTRR